MANNPKLAAIGKYIIAFEIFWSRNNNRFQEKAQHVQEIYSLRAASDRCLLINC